MISIYKCRLCGKTYNSGATGNKKLAMKVTIAAALNQYHPDALAPRMNEVHYCDDGSYGIADFQGMKID